MARENHLSDFDSWGPAEEAEAIRLFGQRLQKQFESGVPPDPSGIAYELAIDLFGLKADELGWGDSLHDYLADRIRDSVTGHLVWIVFEGRHPGGGHSMGIEILDLGNEGKFLVDFEPNARGSLLGGELLAVVDDERGDEATEVAIEYLARGVLGDEIYLPSTISKKVARALVGSVLAGPLGDWHAFAESIDYHGPVVTDSDKAALIGYFVDTAIHFHD